MASSDDGNFDKYTLFLWADARWAVGDLVAQTRPLTTCHGSQRSSEPELRPIDSLAMDPGVVSQRRRVRQPTGSEIR